MNLGTKNLGTKNLAAKCVSYAIIIGGVPLALAYGALWLISADPASERIVYRPPLPPRIADSIARRQEPPPPQPAVTAQPVATPLVMQGANVALHPPPARQVIRESRPPRSHPKRPSKPDARMQAQPLPIAPAPAVVTTARSDVPF
jgi:hypothetical protein